MVLDAVRREEALAHDTSCAAIYFEVEPGKHCGRHSHAAEDIVLILDGDAQAELGDERRALAAGGMALVPAFAPHDIHNVGERTCASSASSLPRRW